MVEQAIIDAFCRHRSTSFGEAVREHVKLAEAPQAVDLRDAMYLLGGDADPTDGQATEQYETNAWTGHQGTPVATAMVLAGLFTATLFVMWLAFSFASSGGPGGAGGVDIVSGTLLLFWGLQR